MADLSITAAEVVPDTAQIKTGIAGEAITVGMSVYKKASDGKLYKAIDTSAAAAAAVGIASSSCSAANQSITYQKSGTIVLGASASVAQGAVYVVSGTAGGIAPEADAGAGNYLTILGVGDASDGIVMPTNGPHASGVAHA
jgi:hypothetical protein